MNWKSLLLLVVPVLLGIVIYLPVLSFEFAWLDHFEILEGGLIIDSWQEFLSTFFHSDGNYSLYHRPVYNIAHTLDLFFWNENAGGFHGTNLLLHGVNLVLLSSWLIRLKIDKTLVAVIVLSWAMLPINASVVALIHAKGDLLTTMFLLITLNILQKSNFRGAYVMIGLSLLLALLSKESAVGGLLMIAIWKWDEIKKRSPLTLTLSITLVAFFVLRMATDGGMNFGSFDFVRLLTFPSVYASYFFESIPGLRMTIADSVWAVISLSFTDIILSSFMFLSTLALQILLWKRIPETRPFILLFNCLLLPVSQLIPTLHFRADRFLYLASFGWIAMFWAIVFRLSDVGWVKALLVILAVGFQTYKLVEYLPTFNNDRSLFTYTLNEVPDCREALSFMGLSAMSNKDYDVAKTYFLQSLNGNPSLYSYVDRSRTKANLATVLMRQGDYYEAINTFQGVEGGTAKFPRMDLNLGICYKMIGKPRKAFDHLTSYQKIFPDELQGMEKMAEVHIDLGEKQKAINEFNKILRLFPDHPNKAGIIDAIYMLGG